MGDQPNPMQVKVKVKHKNKRKRIRLSTGRPKGRPQGSKNKVKRKKAALGDAKGKEVKTKSKAKMRQKKATKGKRIRNRKKPTIWDNVGIWTSGMTSPKVAPMLNSQKVMSSSVQTTRPASAEPQFQGPMFFGTPQMPLIFLPQGTPLPPGTKAVGPIVLSPGTVFPPGTQPVRQGQLVMPPPPLTPKSPTETKTNNEIKSVKTATSTAYAYPTDAIDEIIRSKPSIPAGTPVPAASGPTEASTKPKSIDLPSGLSGPAETRPKSIEPSSGPPTDPSDGPNPKTQPTSMIKLNSPVPPKLKSPPRVASPGAAISPSETSATLIPASGSTILSMPSSPRSPPPGESPCSTISSSPPSTGLSTVPSIPSQESPHERSITEATFTTPSSSGSSSAVSETSMASESTFPAPSISNLDAGSRSSSGSSSSRSDSPKRTPVINSPVVVKGQPSSPKNQPVKEKRRKTLESIQTNPGGTDVYTEPSFTIAPSQEKQPVALTDTTVPGSPTDKTYESIHINPVGPDGPRPGSPLAIGQQGAFQEPIPNGDKTYASIQTDLPSGTDDSGPTPNTPPSQSNLTEAPGSAISESPPVSEAATGQQEAAQEPKPPTNTGEPPSGPPSPPSPNGASEPN